MKHNNIFSPEFMELGPNIGRTCGYISRKECHLDRSRWSVRNNLLVQPNVDI